MAQIGNVEITARLVEEKQEPLFGQYAGATLERCIKVFRERGSQYSDTMRECQFLLMRAVAKELGVVIPDKYLRVLCIAGFADMKYARNLGGYKEDSVEDQINYNGFVAEEMRHIKAGTVEKVGVPFVEQEAPKFEERWFRHAECDGPWWSIHRMPPEPPLHGGEILHVAVLKRTASSSQP